MKVPLRERAWEGSVLFKKISPFFSQETDEPSTIPEKKIEVSSRPHGKSKDDKELEIVLESAEKEQDMNENDKEMEDQKGEESETEEKGWNNLRISLKQSFTEKEPSEISTSSDALKKPDKRQSRIRSLSIQLWHGWMNEEEKKYAMENSISQNSISLEETGKRSEKEKQNIKKKLDQGWNDRYARRVYEDLCKIAEGNIKHFFLLSCISLLVL